MLPAVTLVLAAGCVLMVITGTGAEATITVAAFERTGDAPPVALTSTK
jgi:hypothetical protein